MANPEHLAKLKQGVDAWNQWRKENPDTKVDLSGADVLRRVRRENQDLRIETRPAQPKPTRSLYRHNAKCPDRHVAQPPAVERAMTDA